MRRRVILTIMAVLMGTVFQGMSCLNIGPSHLINGLLQ